MPRSVDQLKAELRKSFCQKLQTIPPERLLEASVQSAHHLSAFLKHCENVLSFTSVPYEIDCHLLNLELAKRGQLLLPKVEGANLRIFHVRDLHKELVQSSWGIWQPHPDRCEECSLHLIELALVPGIAFDRFNQRLGRGKGYYDRFLAELPQVSAYGLGFLEQLSDEPLPISPHDIPLKGTLLF